MLANAKAERHRLNLDLPLTVRETCVHQSHPVYWTDQRNNTATRTSISTLLSLQETFWMPIVGATNLGSGGFFTLTCFALQSRTELVGCYYKIRVATGGRRTSD